MISVIIPAHNEGTVIARSLKVLVDEATPGELDVIVVCNGCKDSTADIARGFGPPVRVIETDVPSKVNALNLGDAAATSFPRIYMDADVVMTLASVRELAAALAKGPALAVAPRVDMILSTDADWAARAYFTFWLSLPYVREGMVTAGVYAVGEEGRRRFGEFPPILADDTYFRMQFTSAERAEVATALSSVVAPGRLSDLVKIRTRSRLGVLQLERDCPELWRSAGPEAPRRKAETLKFLLRNPRLYVAGVVYAAVTLHTRIRAKRQFKTMDRYVWERDNSSRGASATVGGRA